MRRSSLACLKHIEALLNQLSASSALSCDSALSAYSTPNDRYSSADLSSRDRSATSCFSDRFLPNIHLENDSATEDCCVSTKNRRWRHRVMAVYSSFRRISSSGNLSWRFISVLYLFEFMTLLNNSFHALPNCVGEELKKSTIQTSSKSNPFASHMPSAPTTRLSATGRSCFCKVDTLSSGVRRTRCGLLLSTLRKASRPRNFSSLRLMMHGRGPLNRPLSSLSLLAAPGNASCSTLSTAAATSRTPA
mmetsp:Transcript_16770/g.36433  ORF Transcript_16770/g.36433 Transcript_16770/m.36433 type:complete len:248 (+) Transcript_16770:261-1004(+)